MPNLDRLKKLLRYDPETGLFTVLEPRGNIKAGDIIGRPVRPDDNNYIYIQVDGRQWLAHRLAWFMFYEELPREGYEIDHINKRKADNWITNLRELTQARNAAHSKGRLGWLPEDDPYLTETV